MDSLLRLLLCFCPVVAGVLDYMDNDLINEFVDAHNYVRSKVNPTAKNMLYMSWEPALAEIAAERSSRCSLDENLKGVAENPAFHEYGENTFQSPKNTDLYTVDFVVNKWASEAKNYSFKDNSCAPGMKCAHYTQIVRADSYELGCARFLCKTYLNVVCNYGPSGSLTAGAPYTAGSPCSGCYSSYTCSDNLCKSPEPDKDVNPKHAAFVVTRAYRAAENKTVATTTQGVTSSGLHSAMYYLQDCYAVVCALVFLIHLCIAY